ncbi:helix-turn-helix domain-containing protein [Phenylobacterium sp. 58.2.17]|uniref:helix-turn-helix domain-containing protein n=1 Tax=Phenylobacterium sp. 58.2.17 TaxID=2969306 RepID=UPI003A5C0E56
MGTVHRVLPSRELLTTIPISIHHHESDGENDIAMARKWHAEDIKSAVRKKGTTLKALALMNNLSESACRASLRRPQPTSDKVISEFLGVPLHTLWPKRYDASGNRLPSRHVRDETNRNRTRTHRLNAEAF